MLVERPLFSFLGDLVDESWTLSCLEPTSNFVQSWCFYYDAFLSFCLHERCQCLMRANVGRNLFWKENYFILILLSRLTPEEKDQCRSYRVFIRFTSKEEHDDFLRSIIKEHRMVKRTRDLHVKCKFLLLE